MGRIKVVGSPNCISDFEMFSFYFKPFTFVFNDIFSILHLVRCIFKKHVIKQIMQ